MLSQAHLFCNNVTNTEIYTLSLHDALPISAGAPACCARSASPRIRLRPSRDETTRRAVGRVAPHHAGMRDRKSTRLNSSHSSISYAVFCLKKKRQNQQRNKHISKHKVT